MIRRMAMVDKETGDVLNVIIYDDESSWQPPDGVVLIEATEDAEPGGIYDFAEKKFIKSGDRSKNEATENDRLQELETKIRELEKKIEKPI